MIFTESMEAFFAGHGLESFDDFFNCDSVETVNRNSKRDVRVLEFGAGEDKRVFFMKRFFSPHFKDMLFTWRNFGRICSQAECEWKNANLLLDNGIETYRPVCCGWRNWAGIERRSFFVTEKLKGQAMSEFAGENWAKLSQQQKEEVLTSLGRAIRKIHDARISMPDLYIWHAFVSGGEQGDWEFAFIDLHRMIQNVTDQNQLLRNLGRMHHSMVEKYFDDSQKRVLIEAYAGANWPGDFDKLIARVKKIFR